MGESDVKVRGEWMYLYRAVDKRAQTVNFFPSERRNAVLPTSDRIHPVVLQHHLKWALHSR